MIESINNDEDYLIACAEGKLDTMKNLESLGIDINYVNDDGYNAYYIACCQGNLEIIKHLETIGFDINKFDKYKLKAYLISCLANHFDVFKYFDNEKIKGMFNNDKIYKYYCRSNETEIIVDISDDSSDDSSDDYTDDEFKLHKRRRSDPQSKQLIDMGLQQTNPSLSPLSGLPDLSAVPNKQQSVFLILIVIGLFLGLAPRLIKHF